MNVLAVEFLERSKIMTTGINEIVPRKLSELIDGRPVIYSQITKVEILLGQHSNSNGLSG